MTLALAATGPRAGSALFAALRAVERVGSGSIGGFCSFAALGEDGRILRATTQRGGSRTLFLAGERTGVEPPAPYSAAPCAALIASGPERPEPLEAFVAASPTGLVTGHRLPQTHGISGLPYNLETLQRMERGESAREAVETILSANPEGDVGLIALHRLSADLHAANSARVQRRTDRAGEIRRAGDAAVAVLLNAIRPPESLAALAAETALGAMSPFPRVEGFLCARAGLELALGEVESVEIDSEGNARLVRTSDPRLLEGERNAAALYQGAAVMRDGRCLGRVLEEPNCLLRDGRILRLNGQETATVAYGWRDPGDQAANASTSPRATVSRP